MSPEAHQRVRQLFDEALARPEAERMPFLKLACGSNTEVLGQVTQLLAAHVEAADFLQDTPTPTRHIGRYVVARELGRGAMGIVYEATDPLIGRKVAVKVIRLPALADGTEADFLRERLFREARSAGGLFHPGIAVILDVGQDADVAFIAMEYVEGPSLLQVMSARTGIDRAEALRILQQTAAALDFAHAKGVVHRDIKPANIMLEKGVTVKVADFGIAKITSAPQYTQTGMTMGTPSYMSPEQVDAKPLDGKSDQFSLAVVGYELLTGVQPFKAESFTALAQRIVYGPRPSARAVNTRLPPEVDQVFYRALAKNPEERYADCRDFVASLGRAMAASGAEEATRVTVPPLGPAGTVPPRSGKSSRYIVGGVLAALLLAGGSAYIWMSRAPAALPKVPVATVPKAPAPSAVAQPAVSAPALSPVERKVVRTPVAPSIARFEADPRSIEPGAQATLKWQVSGATEVDIEPGIGRKPAADSLAVAPEKSTTYILIAANAAGTARGEAVVEVKPKPPDVNNPEYARQLFLDGESKMRAKQFADGIALLRKAGDLGEVRAMLALGDLYGQEAEGHTRDDEESARWYRKAAEAGDVLGMLDLGGCYELGTGVPQNDEAAAQWYRKAANRDSPSAIYNLARMYEGGRGVPRDRAHARALYQRAADLGDAEAKKWIKRSVKH
jgi:tRNA A-37 threonylcarbamoyl transferase component Bud32